MQLCLCALATTTLAWVLQTWHTSHPILYHPSVAHGQYRAITANHDFMHACMHAHWSPVMRSGPERTIERRHAQRNVSFSRTFSFQSHAPRATCHHTPIRTLIVPSCMHGMIQYQLIHGDILGDCNCVAKKRCVAVATRGAATNSLSPTLGSNPLFNCIW